MQFGEKVRILRKNAGLRQDELAQKIGVTMGLVSAYEHNKRMPSIPILRNLADVLGVTTDYLIYENGQEREGIVRDRQLLQYILAVENMSPEDQYLVKRFLQGFVVDTHLQDLDVVLSSRLSKFSMFTAGKPKDETFVQETNAGATKKSFRKGPLPKKRAHGAG